MKKKSLATILFLGSIATHTVFADDAPSNNTVSPMQMLANTQNSGSATAADAGNAAPTQPTQADQLVPATSTPSPEEIQPPSQTPAMVAPVVDCSYTISQPISQVSADTVIQWANYAAKKTFTYDYQNYDKQFQDLKQCYTTVGWESFMQAMKTSNNLKATQDEHLFVSSKINGQSQLISQSSGETQPAWIVRIPLKVSYQNQDREVSQDMYIDLTIKTIYGSPLRFGINQIIASPKSETPAQQPASSTQTQTQM